MAGPAGTDKSELKLRKKPRDPDDKLTSEHSGSTDGVQPDERKDPRTGAEDKPKT